MAPQTPYTTDLAGREPIAALRETTARIGALAGGWSPADFERIYAPGKWSARQILIHLAQTELALGTRARMALTTPNYAAQSFNQDEWIARDAGLDRPRRARRVPRARGDEPRAVRRAHRPPIARRRSHIRSTAR